MRSWLTIIVLLSVGCGRVVPFDPGTGGGSGGGGAAGGAGGGAGGGSGGACANLSEATCRATPGCVADTCFTCSCTPGFIGCRAAGAAEHQCPLVDCLTPQCCHTQSDCSPSAASCSLPGTPQFCGACRTDPGDCSTDVNCAAGQVCLPMPCSCTAASACAAGCANDEACEDGQQCSGGSHPRCVPSTCAVATDCPRSFSCTGAVCVRKSCNSDSACDPTGGSFCLSGACYAGLGECRLPVP